MGVMGKLTVKRIQSITKPGRYGDGGYAVPVREAWRLQVLGATAHHSRGATGHWPGRLAAGESGPKPEMPPSRNRRAARRGFDPLAGKQRAKVPTFNEAAQKTHKGQPGHAGGLTNTPTTGWPL